MASGDVALVLNACAVILDNSTRLSSAGGIDQNTVFDTSVSAGHYVVSLGRTSGNAGPVQETPFDSTKQYKITIEEV